MRGGGGDFHALHVPQAATNSLTTEEGEAGGGGGGLLYPGTRLTC